MKRRLLLDFALVLGIVASTALPSRASSADLDGRTLERVELRSDVESLNLERLDRLIALTVGAPFRQEDLARTLRNLQASGRVGEVEGYVDEVANGVSVTLAMWGRVQVKRIAFEGQLVAREKDLRAILVQHEGEPLISSRIVRGVYDLENYYKRRGYLAASVRARPTIDRVNKTAVVVYQIDPGPRFEVGSVVFAGQTTPFSPLDLQNQLRMGPGKVYRESGVRADVERLEGWLFSEGYREARVGKPSSTIDWDAATAEVSHTVDAGPQFLIEIRGADEKRLRRKGLLPFMKNQRYDEAILLQSVDKIETYYQNRGYYRVHVDWSETRGEDVVHLVITIDPGPLYELVDIGFTGNQAVPTHQLLGLISTETKRLFASDSGKLSDAALEDDIQNILSYYRINGYWDAQVGPAEIDETAGKLSVAIPIVEGSQRRLVDLTIDGIESVDRAALTASLPLSAGGPYHPTLLDETISAIRSIYRSRGWESVQATSSVEWDDSETLADVTIDVLEGPRSVVDRVVVRGNERTRSRAIRDAVALRSGDFISTDRLLEAQTSLYRLGAFSSVDVRRAPGTPFSGERDVLVEVEEGSRHSFTYGFGLDSEDGFTGLLGYTRSNLFGRGFTGRLDLRVGQDTLARLLVNQPFFGRRRITTTGSVFYIEETRESFESLRRGGQLEARRIGNSSRTGLLFDYRLVDQLDLTADEIVTDVTDPIDPIDPSERDLVAIQIASLTPNWQLDHRNSPVDPTRGWTTTLQIQYAFPFLQANEEFLKGFLQYVQFVDFGRLGSFGGSLRMGAIEPFRDKIDVIPVGLPETLDQFLIPISERYFAGGSTTHRAYRRDALGICGETLLPYVLPEDQSLPVEEQCKVATGYLPLGGNGQVLLNFDYRFPISGPFEGDLFFDSGNVWGTWRDIDLSELKNGLGIGVRYLSPVGPIRLDVGWKLDRLTGEDPYVVFFSVGNAY